MICTKCKDKIETTPAWIKCKPYCHCCYEVNKQSTRSICKESKLKSFWVKWVEMSEVNK